MLMGVYNGLTTSQTVSFPLLSLNIGISYETEMLYPDKNSRELNSHIQQKSQCYYYNKVLRGR